MSDNLPQLNDADWLALERLEYEESLYEFIKEAWKIVEPETVLILGWHLETLCRHLEAVTRGEITRLCISIPPGFMKSLLTSVFWPAWEWTHSPHLRFITTSASEGFCERDAGLMRNIIDSEWYQRLWPMRFPKVDTVLRFVNDRTGVRWGKSFKSLTGVRGNRLILDDVLTVEDGNSEVERAKVNRKFFEQATSRLAREEDAIVIIAQRIHEADLIGEIIDRQRNGDELGFEFVTIPHEWEGDEYISTAACIPEEYRRDPRTNIGDLICPAYRSRKWVEREKTTLRAYAWTAQHQQSPIPRGDGFFRSDDIKMYKQGELPDTLNHYITTDHALGMTNKSDANVVQVWGVDTKNHLWLVDTFRTTGSFRSLLGYEKNSDGITMATKGVFPFIKKYRPLCWYADSDLIINSNKESIRETMIETGLFCRREIVTQGGAGKVERASGLQSMMESGMIHIPETTTGQSMVAELVAFPSGRWRDQVDAATILPRVRTHAAFHAPAADHQARDDYIVAGYDGDGDTPTSNSF